jgi:hypothetical protein
MISSDRLWRRVAGTLLLLAIPSLLVTFFFIVSVRQRRDDGIEAANHVHLISGMRQESSPLFLFRRVANTSNFRPEKGSIEPVPIESQNDVLSSGAAQTFLVGRHFYRFQLSGGANGGKALLRWALTGIRINVGEELGRNPAFYSSGRLAWRPAIDFPFLSGRDARSVNLWMDAVPIRAFTVRRPSDCGSGAPVCIEIVGGDGRITVERQDGRVEHLTQGDLKALGNGDSLWIGHLPYSIEPASGAAGFDLRLTSEYRTQRGDRRGLGNYGFHGEATIETDQSIVVDDIGDRFKRGHLSDVRWEPETEDVYQLMIDHGLLCLSIDNRGGNPAPRIFWRDLAAAPCPDLLGQRATGQGAIIPKAVLDYYHRARAQDRLVQTANEVLQNFMHATPEDLPFVFEWWSVRLNNTLLKIPVALWGVRTGTTNRQIDPPPHPRIELSPGERPVVLRSSRTGTYTVLAQSTSAGTRVYASDLLGLGPLLGVRDSVDGLDNLLSAIPNPGERFELTIDPELQAGLWRAVKDLAGMPGTRSTREYGISGVVMNAATGDVLSVVNWPEALEWESKTGRDVLTIWRNWGVLAESHNRAMLRADKVGSVFKLLALYEMADSGILDSAPVVKEGPECANEFGVMMTHDDGTVEESGATFGDGQRGPIPVGIASMNAGVTKATANSCNTFFAFAATILLARNPPHVRHIDTCPINDSGRRTDAPSTDWIICKRSAARMRGRKGVAAGSPAYWLLLPRGVDGAALTALSRIGFKPGQPRAAGYFGRILDAGFWFGVPDHTRDSRGVVVESVPWGSGMREYEGVPYWREWFADIGVAEGRIFRYPMSLSPRTFFGGGTQEKFDRPLMARTADIRKWRDFAAQSIGEAGEGSPLSLSVLYSSVARDDGRLIAPRLLKGAPPAGLRQIYDYTPTRLSRLRAILRAPIESGTARKLRSIGPREFFGKTGTFDLPVAAAGSNSASQAVPAGCAVPEWSAGQLIRTANDGARLGSRTCEQHGLLVTGIHRYPSGPVPPAASATSGPANEKTETHHTFAGTILPQSGSDAPPVVFAFIIDKPRVATDAVMTLIVLELNRWAAAFRRP